MFVHVCILVLMGLLKALQPWVGLACSTCMCMQPWLMIITTLIITTIISYNIIESSLSHISILYCSLSLSHQHQHQYHYHHISISTHQQHISSTSAAHQHISTITSAWSASHQTGSPLGKQNTWQHVTWKLHPWYININKQTQTTNTMYLKVLTQTRYSNLRAGS